MESYEDFERMIQAHQQKITAALNANSGGHAIDPFTQKIIDQHNEERLRAAQKRDREEFLKLVRAEARKEAQKVIKEFEARQLRESKKAGKADEETMNLHIKSEVKVK